MTTFEERVSSVIRSLRRGEVATYGEVAAEAGHPGAARAVGNVLAGSEGLPWWRVVTSNGRLVPGHEAEQTRRLRGEGVLVRDGRVVLGPVRGWHPAGGGMSPARHIEIEEGAAGDGILPRHDPTRSTNSERG